MNWLVRKEAWKEKNLTGKWKNLYTPIGLGRLSKKRLRQNLTQDELGERIGVQKAQISRMERGYSIGVFYKLRDKERSKESAYVFNLIFRTPLWAFPPWVEYSKHWESTLPHLTWVPVEKWRSGDFNSRDGHERWLCLFWTRILRFFKRWRCGTTS